MDFFEIEPAAKAAFSEQYSNAYLQHLEASKDKRDIAELLWAAFANGYAASETQKHGADEPVAWVDPRSVKSAKVSKERGGPFDVHAWSEGRTHIHSMPLYAAPVAP